MGLESRGAAACDNVTSVPLLDVRRGNQPLMDQIFEEMRKLCDQGKFIGGDACREFETAMAATCQAEFAIGCASGSDALLLSLMALDVGPGDEVIVPSFTFFASVSCITRLGATPVWADIDPQTYNIRVESVADLITERTKAIIPVHLFGQCVEMDQLLAIAENRDVPVVEDSAQAIGAEYRGRRAGSMGDLSCFSFYPTKNLGGFGDGGLITTNNSQLADRVRLLANHGMRPRYYHEVVGINSRLDAMQALVLKLKLTKLPEWTSGRIANAARYQQLIDEQPWSSAVICPTHEAHQFHVWNQFTIRIKSGLRDRVRELMSEQKVGSEIYYPVPCHLQKCFADIESSTSKLTETACASNEVLALPIFPELTAAEQRYVVDVLGHSVETAAKEEGLNLQDLAIDPQTRMAS